MKSVLFFLVTSIAFSQNLTIDEANHLASLPVKCLQQEYPNKLNQLLLNETELISPIVLHPAFYGCFDWHSSVHGHWSLVYLLSNFENLKDKDLTAIVEDTQRSPRRIIPVDPVAEVE